MKEYELLLKFGCIADDQDDAIEQIKVYLAYLLNNKTNDFISERLIIEVKQ